MRFLANELGYQGPPFRWNEERRFLLRCELDAAYFHLYGIDRDDVAYIMDTFPIVRRKDEAAYGEYHTKRVILEIYDEMGSAIGGQGSGYESRLDPPPAHPDAAHPWDEAYLGPELPQEQWWQEASQPMPAPSPTKTVKEPGPSFTLEPPQPQPRPKPVTPDRPAQAPLIADFTPPEGSRSQRLKQVMDLGRLRTPTNIHTLAASLGDKDANVRWLAGSHVVRFGGRETVDTLAAYLASDPPAAGRAEALRVLGLIADADEDETVREMARQAIVEKAEKDK